MRSSRRFEMFCFIGRMFQRFVVIAALGFWLGGFTFYSGVVIHVGHRVFHGQRDVGFLTQQVTNWLNISAAAALAILLWNMLASAGYMRRWLRATLWATWLAMLIIQVLLFRLHPQLDVLLDSETHGISHRRQFRQAHNWYVNLSTTQWAAGLLHVGLVLWGWRVADQRMTVEPTLVAQLEAER